MHVRIDAAGVWVDGKQMQGVVFYRIHHHAASLPTVELHFHPKAFECELERAVVEAVFK